MMTSVPHFKRAPSTAPSAAEDGCATTPSAPAGSDLATAIRVLELEAEGLGALARTLDRSFGLALDKLAQVTGRVVVSGMGKSGHIGRKIAATLASTGTPALFVHPAEASHGDLGMITAADAVLALSNSGETEEMADLVVHARRFAIPLIAITAAEQSTLAQAADICLRLPPAPEACPLGLAPTTSTTMMVALGDAIAVALFARKGFSADEFHLLHPRGALGRRFLRVQDLMHQGDEMPLVAAGVRMADAILEMTAKRFGCVGVIGPAGELAGVVTDGDLRRHMAADILETPVAKIMTPTPKTIGARALAAEALGIMNARAITALFVVGEPGETGARPVGILHIHDILRAGVA